MTDQQPPVPPVPPAQPQPGYYSPQAGAYGQQPAQPTYVAQPYGYAPSPPTNVLAIVAFILAFFVSIAAVICGHIALGQIKRTGEGGRGFALAGVIIGYVSIALTVVFVIVYFLIAAAIIGGVGVAGLNSSNS